MIIETGAIFNLNGNARSKFQVQILTPVTVSKLKSGMNQCTSTRLVKLTFHTYFLVSRNNDHFTLKISDATVVNKDLFVDASIHRIVV